MPSDCRLVSVSGVESEMELAFAALHQLCAPLLDRLDAVPEPQDAWLDRASAQVMAFVARRLGAESLGLVFAARTVSTELRGLPQLTIEGLG
jgi:hypothetical protein